jgi:hypothetical protein
MSRVIQHHTTPVTEDAVLTAITAAAHRANEADRELRVLLAYAREHVHPRPYRLIDLAAACGRSISGVRSAYGPEEIASAAHLRF